MDEAGSEECVWCTVTLGEARAMIGVCFQNISSVDEINDHSLAMTEKAIKPLIKNGYSNTHLVLMGDSTHPEIDYQTMTVDASVES